MDDHHTLAAGEICHDDDFMFRGSALERSHVRALQAIIGRRTKMEPLLVWRETNENGPTGRHVLLDGRHRLAAYINLKRHGHIPVAVFEGSRAEAIERALQANTKTQLPLTTSERNNAAWRLTWLYRDELSIARTAKAAGVSERQVSMMRVRATTMKAKGQEWTGSWYWDRRERDEARDHEFLTDKQRRKTIKELAKALQEAGGMWPRKDSELFAEGLAEAFGHHLEKAADWLFGQDEDDYYREPVGTPHLGPDHGEGIDMNPDY